MTALQSVEPVGVLVEMPSTIMNLDKSSVFVGTPNRINICNHQGTVKNFIRIDESEGELLHMEISDQYLLFSTSKFIVKVHDISRREPKLLLTRTFEEYVGSADDLTCSFISIDSVKINLNGSFLSIFAAVNGFELD